MARVYNFSAGPAVLPEEVLREAADEMLDYQGCGQSVMEMSHRSKVYDNIIKEAEKDLRELMNIPDNYKVLFLQGGASQFFAEVPMNLMKNKKAAYIITGQWAKKAFNEAKIYGDCGAAKSYRLKLRIMRKHLLRQSIKHHGTVIHHNDAIHIFRHIFHTVRYQKNRDSKFPVHLRNQSKDFIASCRIKSCCRLVQNQHIRFHCKYSGDCHTALLSAGQIKRRLIK